MFQEAQHCSIQIGVQHGTVPTGKTGPAAIARGTISAWTTPVPTEDHGGQNIYCLTEVIIGKTPDGLMRHMKPNTDTVI